MPAVIKTKKERGRKKIVLMDQESVVVYVNTKHA